MSIRNKKPVFFGQFASSDVTAAVLSGAVDCLAVTAHSTDALSAAARELIRGLRSSGARVEFFQPGGVEAVLQAANRLLRDIPLEQLTPAGTSIETRLLLVDNAETLEESEIQALRRLSRALRGSPLRTVLFARVDAGSAPNEALEEFLQDAPAWRVDEALPLERVAVETVDPPVDEAGQATPQAPIETPRVQAAGDSAAHDREDVLAELAAERARERGFDATERPWWQRYSRPLGGLALVAVMFAGLYFASVVTTRDMRVRVFDCGVYPDEATLEIVRERLGRTVPTRVLREQEKWRLQVGPLAGEVEAEQRLSQIWSVGPCRVVPLIVQEDQRG
jgi:hypothetical protein